MIELRLEGIKVDVKDDLLISFTYQSIDPDKLSTIKNSFSKTIDISGTSRNNKIFGNLFRIDRYVPSRTVNQTITDIDTTDIEYTGRKNIGYQFDPHKKTEFSILSNGSLVVSGYCVLNEIVINGKNEITYKVTLYGGIGNFFYNLNYNEDGTPKTLYDMFWNWKPKKFLTGYENPINLEEENSDDTILYNASTSIVSQSYHNLKPIEEISYDDGTHYGEDNYWNTEYDLPYPITEIDKDVVFIPCYTGNYDDFDSNKMLVSTFNWNYSPGVPVYSNETLSSLRNMFPESFTDYSNNPDEPVVYTTLNSSLESTGAYRYGIVNFSRDLDPWEAGDLRVNEMPVAIRLSKLLRTVSMPWNNGGYDVEWDEDITNSPYWNYSWVMLGKINQEKETVNIPDADIDIDYNDEELLLSWPDTEGDNYSNIYKDLPIMATVEYVDEILNLNSFPKGRYKLRINAKIDCDFNSRYYDEGWRRYYENRGYKLANGYYYSKSDVVRYRKNVFTLIYEIYSGNEVIARYADFIFFSQDGRIYLTNSDALKLIESLERYYPISSFNIHNISDAEITHDEYNEGHLTSENFLLSHSFSTNTEDSLTIKQKKCVMFVDLYEGSRNIGIYGIDNSISDNFKNCFWGLFNPNSENIDGLWPSNAGTENFNYKLLIQDNNSNGIYLEDTSGFETFKLNKQTLFAASNSPLKYLTDIAKILNLRFVINETGKKISIIPLKKYYKNSITDIEQLVDYSRDISIKNVATNYKFINFGLSNLETYPISLFNRKNKKKFNIHHYDTLIEYNTQNQELLNDSIYKNTLDWQQNSVYYNIIPQIPRAADTPTISWNLFNIDSDDNEKIKKGEIITVGMKSNESSLFAKPDFMPKMSFFDKDNKYSGNDTVLMFLNGFVKNYDYNKSSESSQTETLTPDNINNNHYIKLSDYSIASSSNYQIWEYNNIDENFEYRFSGRGPTTSAQAFVYYYNIGGTCIGYEYKISEEPNLSNVLLHLPVGTKSIKVNMRKEYQSTFKVKKVTNTSLYTIHPRVNLSEDTYEQYFFNGGRCYVYDFKYNDNFNSWGSWSSDQKGCACPWVLPFFTRELYNEYERYEDGYEYNTVRLIPHMKFPNTKFDRNNVILSNPNYSQFEFILPEPEQGWEIDTVLFNATYPDTESGVVLWLQNSGTATVDYQGEYSPSGQHTFVDGTVNIFGGLVKIIRMNTYVAQGGDETYYIDVRFKKPIYHYEWKTDDDIIASWNLVDQNQTAIYDLNATKFLKNSSFNYDKQVTNINDVEDNEYSVSLSSFDYNSVFDTNWKDYMDDLYDRNTRDITLYLDLTGLGMPNDILRKIYRWKGFLWIITKIENKKLDSVGKDKFTKCTLHKINNLDTWTNN